MSNNDILALIPHRSPMLLINTIVELTEQHAIATVSINQQASFFQPTHGVPSWIGLEYMGQTAALIGGYQERLHKLGPQLGFLMGTRRYTTTCSYFEPGSELHIHCQEQATVGNSLAIFDCKIIDSQREQPLATAKLSVFRQAINEQTL
jgi:predicted hotdog family 3-hydroxylacyl-ACP dehydratase